VRENYGANYGRLKEIKTRWDPDNVFRRNQNIEPEHR
jgi:FAD/FMN-containing dehydrogenase